VPGADIELELKSGVDALYVTRPQKERFSAAEKEALTGSQNAYPIVDRQLMKKTAFRKTLVMHPLPRIDELAYELDADPRSRYFKQAELGVPVRMALIAMLLGLKEGAPRQETARPSKIDFPIYRQDSGIKCTNPKCVTVQQTEKKYIRPKFMIVDTAPLTLRCVFCEHGVEPKFVASTEWHQGTTARKVYHKADSRWSKQIKPENLFVFDTAADAEAQGFHPSRSIGEAE
jgi:aspartate carbamoyltransferase catalytic subunit